MRSPVVVVLASLLLLTGAACGGGEEDAAPTDAAEAPASPEEAAPSESEPAESAGTAESASGGFTAAIPVGWVSEPPNATGEMYLINETTPLMEIGIVSSPNAGGEAGVAEYITGQRDMVSEFTNVTEVTELGPLDYPVADATATYFDWYFRADTEGGKTDVVERRVVFDHAGSLYEIQLQSPAELSEEAFAALDQVLQSLTFSS